MLPEGYSPDVFFVMPESACAVGWRFPNVEHRTLGLAAIGRTAFERGDNRPKSLRQMTFERIGTFRRWKWLAPSACALCQQSCTRACPCVVPLQGRRAG